jgi:hypothetical protein
MNIRFTSSLTPEDENIMAPALIKAVAAILDVLPIAYMIRIDTSDAHVYHHTDAKSYASPESVPMRAQSVAAAGFEFR